MEIKIGLADSHRELSITSTKGQDELFGEITQAILDDLADWLA